MRATIFLMTRLLVLLATASFADDRAKMSQNGQYDDEVADWSKLNILDLKLGMVLEKVPGFTCGPPPGTNGFTTQNHSCVKFLDARCKSRATKIFMMRSLADLPKGQTCFMDEFTGATYLDRKFMSPPLQAVRLVGTNTTAPLVFEIDYTVLADDLTDDSNLGKALIAKYGPPSFKNSPMQMSWQINNTTLSATCRGTVGPQGEYCLLSVESRRLDENERSLQEEANEAAKKKAAPPAPKL